MSALEGALVETPRWGVLTSQDEEGDHEWVTTVSALEGAPVETPRWGVFTSQDQEGGWEHRPLADAREVHEPGMSLFIA